MDRLVAALPHLGIGSVREHTGWHGDAGGTTLKVVVVAGGLRRARVHTAGAYISVCARERESKKSQR